MRHLARLLAQPVGQRHGRGWVYAGVLPTGVFGVFGLAFQTGAARLAVRQLAFVDRAVPVRHAGERLVGMQRDRVGPGVFHAFFARADDAVAERLELVALGVFEASLHHVFIDGALVGVRHGRHIIRALGAAFNLEARGARIDQVVEVLHHVHVLRIEQVGALRGLLDREHLPGPLLFDERILPGSCAAPASTH